MSSQYEAQVIGINYYPKYTGLQNLTAAANDAESIATQLDTYGYETFRVQRLPRKYNQKGEWEIDSEEGVKAEELQQTIRNLFNPPPPNQPPELALFFFSGHGWCKTVNAQEEVFLATSDIYPKTGDYGIALSWLGEQLQTTCVPKIVVWLDCCHSGELLKYIDKISPDKDYCIITATRSYEPGIEISHQEGLFTGALKEGLNPDNYPDGIVDSHKLAQYIKEKMSQTGQSPQFACSTKTIILTTKYTKNSFKNICPYRSLSFFTEQDAQVFYGRSKVIIDLIEKIKNKHRLITIFGQSGSGKSSLLRAGLLYQLKLGQIVPESNNWKCLKPLTPGINPVESLLQALSETLETNQPIIIIIDQFEECFTMCDEINRQEFIDKLTALLNHQENLYIIIGIRSDFRQRLREYPQFTEQMTKVNLGHLNREEIQEVIEKPAQWVGLGIEGSLKQQLINDVEDYPGSLPLLQYTLTELWKETRNQGEKFLRLNTYQELGRIEGTLEKRADAIYHSLSEKEQKVAQRIFLELTQVGEAFDARRRVCLGDLANSCHSLAVLDRVTQILASPENRLITRETPHSENLTTNQTSQIIIDVVHEALIRHWGQLQHWQEEYQAGMIIERKIEVAAQEWAIKAKNADYLLRGARLTEAEEYLEKYGDLGMLDGVAESFIRESHNLRVQQEEVENIRRQQELDNLEAKRQAEETARIESEKRIKEQTEANQKLRQGTRNLTILAIIALSFGITSIFLAIQAQENTKIAHLRAQAASVKAKLAINNRLEHYIETIAIVGKNQKINNTFFFQSTKGFNPKTNLIPEVQSVLYDAVSHSKQKSFWKGHEGSIFAVAFSPDGKYLVSAGTDKTLKLWSLESEELLHTFKGHQDWIFSIAFSPDGKYLVSGSKDKTLKLWSVESQQLLHTFIGHDDSVFTVAFSSDGKYLVSGSKDKTLKLWSLESKEILHTFKEHQDWINSVAFSHNGKYLISASEDKTIKLWDILTQKLVTTYKQKSPVNSVAFTPDSNYFVIGNQDKRVNLWHIQSQKLVYSFEDNQGAVDSVALSPNGKYLVAGSKDGKVTLWNLESQQLIDSLEGHTSQVNSVAFSSDGQYFLSGSSDKTMRLWSIQSPQILQTLSSHHKSVQSIAFSPNSKYFVSGSKDKTIKLWDVKSQKLLHIFEANQGEVFSLAFSSNSRYIVSGSEDNTVKLWDIESNKLLHTFEGHQGLVFALAFSPDGKYLVSGSEDNTIKLWNTTSKQLVHTFQGHQGEIFSVAFSSDGKYLVSGSQDKTIKLWDITSQKLVRTFEGHQDWVFAVAFSPDNKYLVSGSKDKTINLWDIQSQKLVDTFEGHQDWVFAVAFSPDGKYLVSGSKDKTINLWDIQSRQLLHTFKGHQDWVNSVVFSPDGKYLVSGSKDKTVKLWLGSNWENWLQIGCQKLKLYSNIDLLVKDDVEEAQKTCSTQS